MFMHIYKFRVKFEDQDDFLREIEVRSDQTFDVFYKAVVDNLTLDPEALSSFFICDHKYRKKLEISLIDMNQEPEGEGGKRLFIMSQTKLSDFIDDPHQKLLLEYDYLNSWTFYIELLRIFPANPGYVYPRFSRAEGDKPRELLKITIDEIPDEDIVVPDFDFEHEEGYDAEELEGFEGADDFIIDDNSRGGLEDETP